MGFEIKHTKTDAGKEALGKSCSNFLCSLFYLAQKTLLLLRNFLPFYLLQENICDELYFPRSYILAGFWRPWLWK